MSRLEIFLDATKDYVQEEREFYLTNNLLQILDDTRDFKGIVPQQTNLFYSKNKFIKKFERKKEKETQEQKYVNFRYFEIRKDITPESLSVFFKLQEWNLNDKNSEKELNDLSRTLKERNLLEGPKNIVPSSAKTLVWAYVPIPSFQVELHPTKLTTHKLIFPSTIKRRKEKLQILNEQDFLSLEEQLYETKAENRLVHLVSIFPNWKKFPKDHKGNLDGDDLYRVFPLVSTHTTAWESIYKALPPGIDLSEETTVCIVVKNNQIEPKMERGVAKKGTGKSSTKSKLLSLSAALLIRMKIGNMQPSSQPSFIGTIVLDSRPKEDGDDELDEEEEERRRKALEGVRKVITFNSILSLLYLGLRKIRDNGIPTYLQLTADMDHKKVSLIAENNFIVQLELIRNFFYPFSSCQAVSLEKQEKTTAVTEELQKAKEKLNSLTSQLRICKESKNKEYAQLEIEHKNLKDLYMKAKEKAQSHLTSKTDEIDEDGATRTDKDKEENSDDLDENIAEKILTRSHTSDIIDFVEKSS